jgi:hypothetical protein
VYLCVNFLRQKVVYKVTVLVTLLFLFGYFYHWVICEPRKQDFVQLVSQCWSDGVYHTCMYDCVHCEHVCCCLLLFCFCQSRSSFSLWMLGIYCWILSIHLLHVPSSENIMIRDGFPLNSLVEPRLISVRQKLYMYLSTLLYFSAVVASIWTESIT